MHSPLGPLGFFSGQIRSWLKASAVTVNISIPTLS